jgi:hypothetical protein
MAKVNVYIEEHLVRKVEIEVPDELTKDERMELAEDKATDMYRNGEIVLDADDFNGVRLMMVQDEDGFETSWNEF